MINENRKQFSLEQNKIDNDDEILDVVVVVKQFIFIKKVNNGEIILYKSNFLWFFLVELIYPFIFRLLGN